MFFFLFKVEVTHKIYNVPQLPSLRLFCSPPEQGVKMQKKRISDYNHLASASSGVTLHFSW